MLGSRWEDLSHEALRWTIQEKVMWNILLRGWSGLLHERAPGKWASVHHPVRVPIRDQIPSYWNVAWRTSELNSGSLKDLGDGLQECNLLEATPLKMSLLLFPMLTPHKPFKKGGNSWPFIPTIANCLYNLLRTSPLHDGTWMSPVLHKHLMWGNYSC